MAAGGVWVFRKDGVMELQRGSATASRSSKDSLGWEQDRALVQLRRRGGGDADLISLPLDFAGFRSTHMYDVVVKNRGHFKVVDLH